MVNKRRLFVGTVGASASSSDVIYSVLEYFIRITSSDTDYSMFYSLNLTPSRRTAAVAMTKNEEIIFSI